MTEQEIELSPLGKNQFDVKQQEWIGDGVVQSCHIAGQQMLLLKHAHVDQVIEYELHYLGLKVGGFTSEKDAKFNAPSFAKSVFFTLDDLIVEENGT